MKHFHVVYLFIVFYQTFAWIRPSPKTWSRSFSLFSQKSSQPPFQEANDNIDSFKPSNKSRKQWLSQEISGNSKFSSSTSLLSSLDRKVGVDASSDFTVTNTNPDRSSYARFFHVLSNKNSHISLSTFYKHDDVKMLLDGEIIHRDQIHELWNKKVYDNLNKQLNRTTSTSPQSQNSNANNVKLKSSSMLNEVDSYAVLCSVLSSSSSSSTLINTSNKQNNTPVSQGQELDMKSKGVPKETVTSTSTTKAKSNKESVISNSNNNNGDGGNNNNDNNNNNDLSNNDENEGDGPVGEDLRYLEQQFRLLAKDQSEISWNTFIHWEEIQALVTDGYCTLEDVRLAWKKVIGNFKRLADLNQFITINRGLDELVDSDDSEEKNESIGSSENILSDTIEFQEGQFTNPSNTRFIESNLNSELEAEIENSSGGEYGIVTDLQDLNPWDPSLDPTQVFDESFILYLKDFFHSNSQATGTGLNSGLLSYDKFAGWNDIKQMLKDGQVDNSCLKDLWIEALTEFQYTTAGGGESLATGKIPSLQDGISMQTFLRMNIRLDMLMDAIEEALSNLTDEEVEGYYRKEFEVLSDHQTLLSYSQLMSWRDLHELIENGSITQEQLDQLWNALPKQPMGAFYKATVESNVGKGSKKGFAKAAQSDGITVEAFLIFNEAIEDIGSSEVMGETGG